MIEKTPSVRAASAKGAVAIGARATGAAALGALALGAAAIGALAIGRLSVGRARVRRLEIGELVVDHLSVRQDGAVASMHLRAAPGRGNALESQLRDHAPPAVTVRRSRTNPDLFLCELSAPMAGEACLEAIARRAIDAGLVEEAGAIEVFAAIEGR